MYCYSGSVDYGEMSRSLKMTGLSGKDELPEPPVEIVFDEKTVTVEPPESILKEYVYNCQTLDSYISERIYFILSYFDGSMFDRKQEYYITPFLI